MGWVVRLSSPYASENRAVVINAVMGICYRQPDEKGKRMNLPSNWVTLVEGPCSQGLLETLLEGQHSRVQAIQQTSAVYLH